MANKGLQLQYGIQPTNAVPVDFYSGPYIGNTEQEAKDAANLAIDPAVRFNSLEVRLIINGFPKKYWYYGGTASTDLKEFTSSSTGATGATGVGIQGERGATGATGVGIQGERGATGASGSNGRNGINGINGVDGSAGQQGPAGNAGAVGVSGLIWKGSWSASATYSMNHAVGYASASWFCYATVSNAGPIPNVTDSPNWALLAAQGAQGNQGIQGVAGTAGANGTNGTNGTNGINGADGTNGINGTNGTNGLQGATGATGVGLIGPQGATGATGVGLIGPQGATGSTTAATYSYNMYVAIPAGQSFGKYAPGSTVPSLGQTAQWVIEDALTSLIPPTVLFTSVTNSPAGTSPYIVPFSTLSPNITLNFTYSINNYSVLGVQATCNSVILEVSRDINFTSPTTLTTDINLRTITWQPGIQGDTASPYYFRYIVTDSRGSSAQAIFTATITPYVAPSFTAFSVGTYSVTSLPEIALKREKGNVASNITFTINRQTPNVSITSYKVEYLKVVLGVTANGGAWQTVNSAINVSNNLSSYSGTITHNDTATHYDADKIIYRLSVYDGTTTTTPQANWITINFVNMVFYGPVSAFPTSSSEVRLLGNATINSSNPANIRIFADSIAAMTTPGNGGTFVLNTGTISNKWCIAVPATILSGTSLISYQLEKVFDTTSTAPINDFFSTGVPGAAATPGASWTSPGATLSVADYYGTSRTYKIYKNGQNLPYSDSNHIWNVFRG
jgi:hypothetical protein